jgi:hypothetical protein
MERVIKQLEYKPINIFSELEQLSKLFVALNNGVPMSLFTKKAIIESVDMLLRFALVVEEKTELIKEIIPIKTTKAGNVFRIELINNDFDTFGHDFGYHVLCSSLPNLEGDEAIISGTEMRLNLKNMILFLDLSEQLKGKKVYICREFIMKNYQTIRINMNLVFKKPKTISQHCNVYQVVCDAGVENLKEFLRLAQMPFNSISANDIEMEISELTHWELFVNDRDKLTNVLKKLVNINQKQRFHHAVGLEQLKLSILGLTQVMEGNAKSLSDVDLNDGKFAEITGNIASLNELYSEHPEAFNPDEIPEELDYLAWSKIYGEFSSIYKSLEPMFEYFEKNRDQLTSDFRKTKAYKDMKKTREEAIQTKKFPSPLLR